jgi:hypothetical protein
MDIVFSNKLFHVAHRTIGISNQTSRGIQLFFWESNFHILVTNIPTSIKVEIE